MYKRLLALLCCLLLAVITFANEDNGKGNITGIIKTNDGQPAAAVSVSLKGTRLNAITNDDGSFAIHNVPAGIYKIEVTLVGYETFSREVTVENKKTATVAIELAISDKKLQEVVVVGGKNNAYKSDKPSASLRLLEPILQAPQNIQIITGKILADQQITSMSDGVIKNVAGATRVEHWADLYTRVNMRGGRAGAFRNGVNVTSDWGPLNEDMSFVDHIEFVKGPAGFMMSNGEPSGMYNVVTKKPTFRDFNGEAIMTLGSFDFYRAAVDFDGKLDKAGKVGFRLNLMDQNKGSFRPNEFNNRAVIAPVLSFKLDDATQLTVEYTYQHAKMSDVGSAYLFSPDGFGKLPRNYTFLLPGVQPTNIDDHSVFVNLQHQISTGWKLTAQVAYFNYKQIGSDMWPDQVNADGTLVRAVGNWDAVSEYKYGQVFVNGDVNTGKIHHRILGGLDVGNKDYAADFNQYFVFDNADAPFNPLDPNADPTPANGYPKWDESTPIRQRPGVGVDVLSYTGLYAQDELGFFNNMVRLTLAGRFTYAKQNNYGDVYDAKHVTPRVGLSVSVNQQTSVYALYDQSFLPQSGLVRAGGKIKPLTGNNMEVGIKRDWMGGRWSSTLTAYRILNNNGQFSDPSNTGTEHYVITVGQNKAQGIEFDVRGELFPGLSIVANYAYTDSKVTKGAEGSSDITVGGRVPGYATHDANAWLTYKIQNGAMKGFGVSTGVSFQADRDGFTWVGHDGIEKLPTYFRWDGGAFYEKGKMMLTANVFNLLDKKLYQGGYEDWATPSYYSYQYEAPANYKLSIGYKF